jgi:sulfur-carrier protein adenylyltransferase/sulfurtransferase
MNEVAPETVRRLVDATRSVPTGENCQPWRFSWDGRVLSVLHVPDRAKKQINYDDRVSMFSLGFLLETLRIAASAEGLAARFRTRFSEAGETWAEVELDKTAAPADPLHEVLARRFTDRRPFRGGSLPPELLQKIEADAGGGECRFHWSTRPTKDFLRWVCEAETYFWHNKAFHSDYTRWIRLTRREIFATRDGLPWWSLGVPFLISRLLIPLKDFKVQQLGNRLGFLGIARNVLRKQIRSSAALCCITVPSPTPEALVKAGELSMRAWLYINQYGFGFHPLSLVSFFPYYLRIGVADQVSPGLTEMAARGEAALRDCFGYAEDELPLWFFRAGLTAGFPERRTLRLHTEELLSFEAAAGERAPAWDADAVTKGA